MRMSHPKFMWRKCSRVLPRCNYIFGSVQKIFNFFSSSPPRREIFIGNFHVSSFKQSDEMVSKDRCCNANCREAPWDFNVIKRSRSEIGYEAESRTDLNALIKYFSSFRAAILTTTWYKVLQTIDYRSNVLHARDCTVDVEVRNLQSLLDNLSELRNNWE